LTPRLYRIGHFIAKYGPVQYGFKLLFHTIKEAFIIFVMIFAAIGFFSILGWKLFSELEDDHYFNNLEESFITLQILITTANFPDCKY